MGFFDDTKYNEDILRLNERYKRLILPNLHHIIEKRILDLGSYNGRWAYAAFANNAMDVVEIEGRRSNSSENSIIGDVIDVLSKGLFDIDTIFCFGLLYHITDHFTLFRLMDKQKPKAIIIDSLLLNTMKYKVRIYKESTKEHWNAIPYNDKDFTFVGIPSKGLIEEYASFFGYDFKYIDWKLEDMSISSYVSVKDYFIEEYGRQRYTMVLERRSK